MTEEQEKTNNELVTLETVDSVTVASSTANAEQYYTRKFSKFRDFMAGFWGCILLFYLQLIWSVGVPWDSIFRSAIFYSFIAIVITASIVAIFNKRRFITWGIAIASLTLILLFLALIMFIGNALSGM